MADARRRVGVATGLAAGVAMALAACDGTATELAPDAGTLARSDSLVYHLRRETGAYRAYATVTLTNATAAPLHYARCSPASTGPMFYLHRTGADSARTFFTDWAWACVGGVPTGSLAPGASLSVHVPLGSVDQPNMYPPLRPEHLVGLVRVTFALCRAPVADSDACEPLAGGAAESNAFDVRY